MQRPSDPSPGNSASLFRRSSDAGAFGWEGETELIHRIDLRGIDGADGQDGASITDPSRVYGADGRRGGDATRSATGGRGGSIDCRLSYRNHDRLSGEVRLRAELLNRSSAASRLDHLLAIGHGGFIVIDAAGGKGGNGGRGGDGQPGSQGAPGRDATRFSAGTDGGDGGDGGDAGNPSDGSRGGDGGNVTLQVAQSDTGLLMLCKGNLAGGEIGFAGEPGRGGRGGAGGKGGSGYHWTTTSRYTDSKGNVQTQTHHHYNPGGSDGRDGRSGADSFYRARDGEEGSAGWLRIVVVDDRGIQTEYDSPYDLQLINFDVVGEYAILEPDSLISIENIEIQNVGGMPTPANYTIRVFIESDDWLIADGGDLLLPHPLAPGESLTFSDHGLRIRLGDQIVDAPRNRAFRLHQAVSPLASMESGIGRRFRNFENSQQIQLQFPVELTAIRSLNSLAPGESTRVIWSVTNLSEETFDQKYLYRAVRTNIKLIGGDLALSHLVFFDTDDAPFNVQRTPFTKPVQQLGPGRTVVFETRVGVKQETAVVAYQGFAIGVDLDLQRPKSSSASDQYRCVDSRRAFIRVAERYRRDQDSRFLLVANEQTTVNDIEKWTQLADYFGSGLDVWDISYYGFLDLFRAVDQNKSLLEQWRGMTMIIPNNYYQTPAGKTVAFDQLAKAQFVRAAADFDICFYIVGDSRTGGSEQLQSSLIPVESGKSPSQLKTQKQFLRGETMEQIR